MIGKQLAALKHRAHIGDTGGINVCHRFAPVDLRQQALKQRAAPAFADSIVAAVAAVGCPKDATANAETTSEIPNFDVQNRNTFMSLSPVATTNLRQQQPMSWR